MAGLVVGTPPWAAMVCFVGAFVAVGSDCGYVAVGNERSANEGNGVDCEEQLFIGLLVYIASPPTNLPVWIDAIFALRRDGRGSQPPVRQSFSLGA